MAELPSKVYLILHPIVLRICGASVYEDKNQRTCLHFVMDTVGVLQVRLRQEHIPRENITLTTNPLTSSSMPSWWMLQVGSRYLDSMGRFWRIVHHVEEDDMEEMILELMDNSHNM